MTPTTRTQRAAVGVFLILRALNKRRTLTVKILYGYLIVFFGAGRWRIGAPCRQPGDPASRHNVALGYVRDKRRRQLCYGVGRRMVRISGGRGSGVSRSSNQPQRAALSAVPHDRVPGRLYDIFGVLIGGGPPLGARPSRSRRPLRWRVGPPINWSTFLRPHTNATIRVRPDVWPQAVRSIKLERTQANPRTRTSV